MALEWEGMAGLGISYGPAGGPKGQELSLLPTMCSQVFQARASGLSCQARYPGPFAPGTPVGVW